MYSVSIQRHGRKKQSTRDKDEGGTHKHDSQVSSCGGKQAEKSFSKKLKNVKEQFKGMKVRALYADGLCDWCFIVGDWCWCLIGLKYGEFDGHSI